MIGFNLSALALYAHINIRLRRLSAQIKTSDLEYNMILGTVNNILFNVLGYFGDFIQWLIFIIF